MIRRAGIRSKIATVILLCMIPVLVLGVVLYVERDADRRSTVVRTQEELARALALEVDTFFATAVHTERLAGAAVTSQPYPVRGITHLFAGIRSGDPSFVRLTLVLPTGRAEAGDPALPARTDVASRPFRRVRSGAEWAVGAPRMAAGRPVAEVATAIRERGRLVAVVDGFVDLSRLPTALPATAAPDADAVVLDPAAEVMLDLRHGARAPGGLRTVRAVAAALGGRSGYINAYRDPVTGRRDIGAAVPIPSLGWAAVVLVPETTAYEPVRHEALIELFWLAAYAALGLGLAWTLGGELSAPIQALARGARAIGRGEIGHRVSFRRTDELGELASAFNEMSAQLERYVSEMSALQAVSDAALSTVRLDELLPPLVQRIVATLRGDGAAVWFVDETTGELVVPDAFGGNFPGASRRLRPGDGLAGRTANSRRAVQVAGAESLRAVDEDLAAHGVQSALSVPLRAGGQVIGVIQVLFGTPREFAPRDVRLLETFADRVALAVDNARAYERQQEIARIIQQALMPSPSARLPGASVAGRYQPSREVGGDFYAALPLGDGRIGLAIADVAGKGIPAATLAARTRYLLEALALEGRDPADVLARLNAVLARDPGTTLFVSLYYAVLDPPAGVARFATAGHVPPLLLRAGTSEAVPLESSGLLLGILPDARYESRETAVGPGDLLVLFTDGLTEARRADGELFGEQRLASAVAAARDGTSEEVADAVMDAVVGWAGPGPRDDRALAVVRVLPAGTATVLDEMERPPTAVR